MTVHIVNLTNPMMMKGPLREVLSRRAADGADTAAGGRACAKVQLLTAGTSAATTHTDGHVDVTVPSVAVHEVIAID